MLNHVNMIWDRRDLPNGRAVALAIAAVLPADGLGRRLTYSLGTSMVSGATINFPESPETVRRDHRELGPSVCLAPPRLWENMLTGLQVRAADPRAQAPDFRVFPRARRAGERSAAGKPSRPATKLAAGSASPSCTGRCATSSGLRAGPAGLHRRGAARRRHLPLLPRHRGQPKAGLRRHRAVRAVSVQPNGQADPKTVGRMFPGTQVRIDERGEVLVKGPGVFLGYYKQPETTRKPDAGRQAARRATPGSSTRAASWRSSTGPRMSASWPTARRLRRSSSRTS